MKENEKNEQSYDCNELSEEVITLYIRRGLFELSYTCADRIVEAFNEQDIHFAEKIANELKELMHINSLVEDVIRDLTPSEADNFRALQERLNNYLDIWNDVCARAVELIVRCCETLDIKNPKFIPPEFIEYFKEHPSNYDWDKDNNE